MSNPEFVQITRQNRIREGEFYPVINRMYERIWQNLLPPQLVTDGLASKVQNNLVTPHDSPIPDCQSCGACCVSHPCVGVRASENVDPDLYWNITSETDGVEIVVDRYMRRDGETFACVALEGDLGRHVSCTIYEKRPRSCRHLEAGSDRCRAIRRAFGFEPFLSLEEMSNAMVELKAKDREAEPWNVIRTAEIKLDDESDELVVLAHMKDGKIKEIHRYDPANETWMQFEFDGLTLEGAKHLIASGRRA